MKNLEDMTTEEIKALPWDYPGMISVEGRYYYGLGFIHTEPGAIARFGGDVISQLWRFENEPDVWRAIYRIRTYSGSDSDPWVGGDRKKWFVTIIRGSEELVGKEWKESLTAIGNQLSLINMSPMTESDFIIVQGDCDKMTDAMMTSDKLWMHKRTIDKNEK